MRKSFTFEAVNHPVADIIVLWYDMNKRSLPWRETRDPYLIWLSEVILQQTRVIQGMDYYLRFASTYPDVFRLAEASETTVLKHWQGLGYYSRARNLHKTAKIIVEKFKGIFPGTSAGLMKLPGIGKYTAAAIASIAFNENIPAVDGNVIRVISRLYGIKENALSGAGYQLIFNVMVDLMQGHSPGTFNQAVMEFGALQCLPLSPDCPGCPVRDHCFAFSHQKVDELPVRSPKTEVSVRYFNYLVITVKKNGRNYILLNRRSGRDIWHNLYDFPSVDNNRVLNAGELAGSQDAIHLLGSDWVVHHETEPITHLLTHRRIIARFFSIRAHSETPAMKNYHAVMVSDLKKYPLPKLIDNYIHQYFREL